MNRLIIVSICMVLFPVVCFAEDIYISETQQGTDSGLNCSNSHSASWFNIFGNWANPKQSGKIGPGDTAHLCGTITTQLTTQASGDSASPITILFETGTKYSNVTWTTLTGAVTIKNNYITLDGGTNGIIEATDNGTTSTFGGTKTYNRDIYGVLISAASNVIVKNLIIRTIYDRLASSTDCVNVGRAIQVEGNSNNITFDSNIVSDAKLILSVVMSNTSGITVLNNTVRDGGIGINIAPGNTSTTGLNIGVYGNDIRGGTRWDGTYDANCQTNGCSSSCLTDNHVHQDGIHIFSQGVNGWLDNVDVYNNYLQDFGTHSTGHIYLEGGYITNIMVYNNVVVNTGVNRAANGMIDVTGNDGAKIFNNTIIGAGGTAPNIGLSLGSGSGDGKIAQNVSIENNIFSGIFYFVSYVVGTTFTAFDYNDYYDSNATPFYNGSFHNLTWWQAQGYDTHGMTANPLLDINYKITTSSPTILHSGGTNLSSIFTIDKDNLTRPAVGGWSLGAYQSKFPNPPTNLQAQ